MKLFESLKTKWQQRVSVREQILYTKRLSFLLGAHVALDQALSMLAEQSGRHRVIFEELKVKSAAGLNLSTIVGHAQLFGVVSTPLLRIGEETGMLEKSFERISGELEKKHDLLQKLFGALLYPCVVIAGTGLLVLVLIVAVFPRLASVFEGLHVELPLTTRLVMLLAILLERWWWLLIIVLIMLVAGLRWYYVRSKKFRRLVLQGLLKLPIISQFVRLYYGAQLTRMMGLLLESGSQLTESLLIVREHIKHDLYEELLMQCHEVCVQGGLISQVLDRRPDLFALEYVYIISAGEQSGTLAQSLLYCADVYSRELDHATKQMTSSIEPILMIGIGLVVAGIALSIITPMYQITQNLHVR